SNEDVLVVGFGVLNENVKVTVFPEHARVEKFEFRLRPATSPVFVYQPAVGKFSLRILVQILHVAVRRCRVEVKVVFLYVLAMIPFVARETKNALFENWIAAIPQGKRETNHLMAVADTRYAVFSPAIGAGTGVIVREEFPSGAAGAVVFTDGSPLALGKIRPPAFPIAFSGAIFLETSIFGSLESGHEVSLNVD